MADVSKIFKPRRGKVSTMLGTKASTVLAAGEMFFEVPDTGVGTGRGRIMMGDGSTTYVNLAGANNNTGANSQAAKYFMPFTQDEVIIHPGTDTKTVSQSSSIQSAAVAENLNNAKSGNALKTIVHNLREAIYKNACDIAKLNNDLSSSSASGITAISTGDGNGQIKYTKNGSNTNVSVKGLGSAAYTASTAYAAASHTHSGYAASSHTHDDRYYTESEINTKLNEKLSIDSISSASITFSVGSGEGRLYKYGKLVIFSWVWISGLPSINTEHKVAIIPSGYRPNFKSTATVVSVASSIVSTLSRFSIFTNGEVWVTGNDGTNQERNGTTCWSV